jgi:hypothetical protein
MELSSVYGLPWVDDAAGDVFVLFSGDVVAFSPVPVLPAVPELEVGSFSVTTVDVAIPLSAWRTVWPELPPAVTARATPAPPAATITAITAINVVDGPLRRSAGAWAGVPGAAVGIR